MATVARRVSVSNRVKSSVNGHAKPAAKKPNAELWSCSNAEYHAETKHVSSTALKVFIENPATYYRRYVARTEPIPPPTKEMVFGSVFHSLFLENEVDYAVFDGRRYGAKWDEFLAEHAGQNILTPDEEAALEPMCRAVRRNKVAMQLLESTGHREIACKWTHASGIRLKCRWDHLALPATQVDLKTAADPTPAEFAKAISNYGYDLSNALYTQGAAALLDEPEPLFRWVVVEKDATAPRCYVHRIPNDALVAAHRCVNSALHDLARRRESNDWTDPLSVGVNEINLPAWHFTNRGWK